MSILIKGMEMPKNCRYCFYFACGCRRSKRGKQRPQTCPLIEIPDIYIDMSKAFMTELTDKVCIKGDEE